MNSSWIRKAINSRGDYCVKNSRADCFDRAVGNPDHVIAHDRHVLALPAHHGPDVNRQLGEISRGRVGAEDDALAEPGFENGPPRKRDGLAQRDSLSEVKLPWRSHLPRDIEDVGRRDVDDVPRMYNDVGAHPSFEHSADIGRYQLVIRFAFDHRRPFGIPFGLPFDLLDDPIKLVIVAVLRWAGLKFLRLGWDLAEDIGYKAMVFLQPAGDAQQAEQCGFA